MLVKQASSCEDFVITDPKLRSSLRDAAPPCGSPWLRSFSPAEVLGCAALPCEVPWLRSSSLRRSLVAQLFPAETLDFADVPAETLGFADVPADYPDNAERVLRKDVSPTSLGS